MRKKKVWIAGCTVFLLLVICTVLSLRIEKMMRIEVETVRAVQCEEEGMTDMVKIPLSCYKQEENGSFVLFFGKEWVVQKEESDPLMEEGNMSLVPKSSVFDDQLRPRKIVNYSTWPLEDDDVVVIAGEE